MDLAVNAIIKEEKLEATDEEVEKQYNDLAEKYSMDVGELKKYLDAMSVRTQIIRDKAISVVVDSAKIERRRLPRRKPRAKPLKARKSLPRRPLPKSPPRRKKKRLNNRQSGHNR